MMTYDYDVSVFIITGDGVYVEEGEYDPHDDGDAGFICLTNDRLDTDYGSDNSILLYGKWKQAMRNAWLSIGRDDIYTITGNDFVTTYWQFDSRRIVDNARYRTDKCTDSDDNREEYLIGYLDGYASCENILRGVKRMAWGDFGRNYVPAVMIAARAATEIGDCPYKSYLPAIGQLLMISYNIGKVERMLRDLSFDPINEVPGPGLYKHWWSSTEFND